MGLEVLLIIIIINIINVVINTDFVLINLFIVSFNFVYALVFADPASRLCVLEITTKDKALSLIGVLCAQ